jgi:hypothetical protein
MATTLPPKINFMLVVPITSTNDSRRETNIHL